MAAANAGKSKPRLLLMGQRRSVFRSEADMARDCVTEHIGLTIVNRSGKSSISSVVFHKVPPSETLFLESTVRIQKDSMA